MTGSTDTRSAIAAVLAQAQNDVGVQNNRLIQQYDGAFNNWVYAIQQGGSKQVPVPVVPNGWLVNLITDGADVGFSFAVPGTSPVCAALPIPVGLLDPTPILPPNYIDVGNHIVSDPSPIPTWFTVGGKDTYPSGKTTPPGTESSDGIVGTYLRVGSPFGGWYEKVG
jgi:hypothetical protein